LLDDWFVAEHLVAVDALKRRIDEVLR
jgi:hypothetical protein